MNILFICRYNRFRSVLAEGFFNKYNKDKKLRAKSAGLIKGYAIDKNTRKLVRKLEIKIKKKPDGLTTKVLNWQDLLVIIADDVPMSTFKNKRYIKKIKLLKVRDAFNNNDGDKVAEDVEKKVKQLIKELK